MGNKYTKTSPIFFQNVRVVNEIKEHKCNQCGEWKPETEEYYYLKNKSKPEKGYQSECKECTIKRARNNAVQNKERTQEMQNKYYIDNREKRLKEFREWDANNKEKRKKFNSEYFKNNPDKSKEYGLKRRQHKKHNINSKEWITCKEYFKDEDGDCCCAYCGLKIQDHYRTYAGELQKIDLHKEHVDDNGSNELDNWVPSCGSCNSSKNRKLLDEFYNSDNPNYTEERYEKIIKWITEDYKKYIEQPKPKGKYTKKIK